MTHAEFTAAILAILFLPGPTNTLMCLAGAREGMAAVARFLPAEILGYLITLLPLTFVGAHVVRVFPAAEISLKIVAIAWIISLAVKVWGGKMGRAGGSRVAFRQVCITTMLNPKALIFGLVFLPSQSAHEYAVRFGLFFLSTICVGLIWGMLGSLTRVADREGSRLITLQRAAATWLVLISALLIASMLRA